MVNVSSLLDDCRTLAGQLLTDTVAITREGGVIVDEWGSETPSEVAVYTGPGLVQDTATSRLPVIKAGEEEHDALGYVGKVLVVVGVRPGDWIRVLESLDPMHVGRKWRITAVPTQALAVLHRCILDPVEVP